MRYILYRIYVDPSNQDGFLRAVMAPSGPAIKAIFKQRGTLIPCPDAILPSQLVELDSLVKPFAVNFPGPGGPGLTAQVRDGDDRTDNIKPA